MRFALAESNHHAPRQKPSQLDLLCLLRSPADLSQHRRGNKRNNAEFQPNLMLRPNPPIVPVGSHKNGTIVNDRPVTNSAHAERRTARCALSGCWN